MLVFAKLTYGVGALARTKAAFCTHLPPSALPCTHTWVVPSYHSPFVHPWAQKHTDACSPLAMSLSLCDHFHPPYKWLRAGGGENGAGHRRETGWRSLSSWAGEYS